MLMSGCHPSSSAIFFPAPMHKLLFICSANYYRSRFAELLFNHLAVDLNWRAESRGVAPELGVGNVGPISIHTIRGLQTSGVKLPEDIRDPLPLTEEDLKQAELIIVLDEAEHRPYMKERFPNWADKVTYWHIADLDGATTEEALTAAEREIRSLIERLTAVRVADADRGQGFCR
jgi:low molecular weight protein-tyrosine phosphatase